MITNREKLDKISSKDMANKIKSLKAIPGFEYIDWESWLKSIDAEFIYIGTMCRFKPYEEMFAKCDWLSGIIVDKQIIAGVEYNLIMSNGAMYKIPENRVEILC